MDALPENGVPEQLTGCAVQMPEVDKYAATRCGPGTIRDPFQAADGDDDASDEISDTGSNDGATDDRDTAASSSVEQPAQMTCDQQPNQFETALGLDPTSTPDIVQHVVAFKAQLDLMHEAVKRMRSDETPESNSGAQPSDASAAQSMDASAGLPADAKAATAQAAAEEECFRAVLGLREAAQKLDKHKFQDKVLLLDSAGNRAMFVPSNNLLSMFNPTTWTQCLSEWWYGDALPNMGTVLQNPKLSFEELFEALPDREELEYQLDSDSTTYRAKSRSRFDTPEHAIVFGDTLKRLLLFRGTRMALKRKGFQ